MTESEIRAAVVAQAKGWLGRKEADGSHREIIDIYNSIRPLPRGYKMTYTDPWCAAFVSAVAQALELIAWIFPECGCGPMIALYRAAGRWMEDDAYLPQIGDVIFYDWEDSGKGDNTGAPDHVGLVTAVDGEVITVTEGNCSDQVMDRKIRRNARYIRGYGLPDYAAAAAALSAAEDPGDEPPAVVVVPASPSGEGAEQSEAEGAVPGPDTCAPELPVLREGDGGEAVMAAQQLLHLRGFRCGASGVDGEFGPATLGAVRRFQRSRGLADDGIIGPETWGKLICT